MSDSDIGDLEIEDESDDILSEMIHSEQLSLLRRELAFIKSEYRDIIVAYYIENRSMKQIASSLSIHLDTVKKRLQRARNILKEGMNMAREFGTRSYNPEQITFINNCTAFGSKGQPWSVLTHSLYKNIFLEAYGNPSTAEDLAYELGIALPYIEEELEFLVRETFLIKNGNKYETNFPIISKKAQEDVFAYLMNIVGKVTSLLENLVDEYTTACAAHGIDYYGSFQSYEDAKWTLLLRAFDRLIEKVQFSCERKRTERPDGGRWDIVGYQDAEIKQPSFVGLHGCMDDPDGNAPVYFQQYKFKYRNIEELTPMYLSAKEAQTLLKIVEQTYADCDVKIIEKLIEYGYVRERDGKYEPAIIVFGEDNTEQFTKEESERISALATEIKNLLRSSLEYSHKRSLEDIPESLLKNDNFKEFASSYSYFERGIVFEQAIADGWIKYDENSSKAIGAFMYI